MTSPQLTYFEITGLHGYKNIRIDCENKASIFLAENGNGKTTLLNSIYAILSGKFERLSNLEFNQINLKLNNVDLSFNKKQAFDDSSFSRKASDIRLHPAFEEITGFGISESAILELLRSYKSGGVSTIKQTPLYGHIYRVSPWSYSQLDSVIARLANQIIQSPYIDKFTENINKLMGGKKILYLPTYRRIEASSADFNFERNRKSHYDDWRTADIAPFPDSLKQSEDDQLLYFGLSDVEEKLKTMTRRIQQSVFSSYNELSANMIDALLSTTQITNEQYKSINIETIKLIFERLGKSSRPKVSQIKKILQESINEKNQPLLYFLLQLQTNYENYRPIEKTIETFVDLVNDYFLATSDEKMFVFDKVKVSVSIEHKKLRRDLPFNSLSSGEKQIVSIFSNLILNNPRDLIILIDEPELSLSLEWQKRFLPDIIKTQSCAQLLAITHSPFIFDNELDKCAAALSISNGLAARR